MYLVGLLLFEITVTPANIPMHPSATYDAPNQVGRKTMGQYSSPNPHTRPIPANQHRGLQVIIASDAAMNPNRDSSFAWLIATNQPLWQGEGVVPGLVEDAHTGCSEAYGLLTAICFLAHYLKHFPMIYYLTCTIVAYCDNSSTISCIEALLQEKPQLSRSTIMDNYDVYVEISQAMHSLHPLHVNYLHIKGHQDKTQPIHKLSKPAQCNVNCDKRATSTLPNLTPFST